MRITGSMLATVAVLAAAVPGAQTCAPCGTDTAPGIALALLT
jgi:hypothetical protein